ncbi:MAG: polysaccharide biosynthesis C-terminal domain-containing protein, partial [Firmicutes bacterium]|nr:polysaccharide biosynthesis C-terminal domain-containing protein [Bacillota bacterium]
FGTAFVQISLGLNTFITTQGFTSVSMKTVLIGAICNIILDPIFIFGLDMGVAGAALATILSQGISALWVLRFLTGKKTILKIRKNHLKIDPKVLIPCLALGFAPFIMQSTESLIMLCFNNSLLKYGGDVAVGAMTVLSSAMQMVMMPLQGLTQGAQPIMSYNFGARKADRVKGTFRFLLTCCLVYSAVAWMLCMSFPRQIGGIFTDNQAIIDVVGWALRVYMGGTIIFGAQIACQQTFVALGNAKTSAFLAIFRKIIVLVPLIFLLPPLFPAEAKTFAVWLAEPIADVAAVTMTTTLFRRQFRRAMEQLETV